VKADGYLPFQSREVPLENLIKIDDLAVGVINDLHLGRFFSEKYCGPSNEGLAV
jgi:hypothetical protein